MKDIEDTDETIKWTDDRIRWSDCEDDDINDDGDDENSLTDEAACLDPFKDPDPTQTFYFAFDDPNIAGEQINIELKGYKPDTDQVWKSTGATLWRASEHLCKYMLKKSDLFHKKRVLELGAGLGLNGILAHHLKSAHVYVTDGDTNAVKYLKQNIEDSLKQNGDGDDADNYRISGKQLLWGKETSKQFLVKQCGGRKFDILLASDIIYSPVIIPPLWETLHELMDEPNGVLVMAFARREVKVTIEDVKQTAMEAGFSFQRVDEQDVDGIFIYEFRHEKKGRVDI